jgi:hypothetical protein
MPNRITRAKKMTRIKAASTTERIIDPVSGKK